MLPRPAGRLLFRKQEGTRDGLHRRGVDRHHVHFAVRLTLHEAASAGAEEVEHRHQAGLSVCRIVRLFFEYGSDLFSLILAGMLAAEVPEIELPVPARGSTEGPWAFAELGVSSTFATGSQRFNTFGGDLSAVAGVGFALAGIRLSPLASFSAGPRVFDVGGRPLVSLEWSSLGLSLAAPDVINDTRRTGLRLTPSIGMTIPTSPGAFDGLSELTRLSAAVQLERRFGRVELAYRLEGAHLPCALQDVCVTRWDLDNTLFLEAWLLPELSLAFGATWSMTWLVLEDGVPRRACGVGSTCQFDPSADQQPNKFARGRLLLSWAFTSLFGATLESHAAVRPGGAASLGMNLGVWFRTDPLLTRNWLDR